MALLVGLFGLFVAALGGLGLIAPARLIALVRRVQTRDGLYAIAGLRLVLGVSLLSVASASRVPDLLRALGVIAIVAAVLTPFFGLARFEKLLNWWGSQGNLVIRVWALVPLALGLTLVWAVLP